MTDFTISMTDFLICVIIPATIISQSLITCRLRNRKRDKAMDLCKTTEEISDPEVLRAEEEWQRAGAYSVRIQGMNRQYHISLRDEFDEHDRDGTRYIVLLDHGYPFATCRFYEISNSRVMLGRVVVLPEYRNRNFGKRAVREAEKWISELGYRTVQIESRLTAIDFYKKLGYSVTDDQVVKSGDFDCVRMKKNL